MLQDLVHPPEQLPDEDDLSSPISSQLFELFGSDLFAETIQTSEATSCSNGCYEENTSYASNFSFQDAENKTFQEIKAATANANTINTTATSTITTATDVDHNNSGHLSMIFDCPEEIKNDISASINFSPSSQFSVPPNLANLQDQLAFSSAPAAVPIPNVAQELSQYPPEHFSQLIGPPPVPSVFEDDCLSSVPSFVPMNSTSPACSFLPPTIGTYLPGTINATMSAENPGIFSTNLLTGPELQTQELDYQGDNGALFCQESFPRVYNPPDLQALLSESQPLVVGCVTSTPLASERTSFDDPTLKVGKLSAEQRKEKIHRYLKKRNERNFSKKIKYVCRKTLADSRPRVRGRFAKSDDFGEAHRNACGHPEDEDDDEIRYIFDIQGRQSPDLVSFM